MEDLFYAMVHVIMILLCYFTGFLISFHGCTLADAPIKKIAVFTIPIPNETQKTNLHCSRVDLKYKTMKYFEFKMQQFKEYSSLQLPLVSLDRRTLERQFLLENQYHFQLP